LGVLIISCKTDQTNINDYIKKAHDLVGSRKYHEAITMYDKAIDKKPDSLAAWHGKGIALLGSRKFEEAIEAFNKAIDIEPDFHPGWFDKGNALVGLGKLEEAIKAYEKALKISESELGKDHPVTKSTRDLLNNIKNLAK